MSQPVRHLVSQSVSQSVQHYLFIISNSSSYLFHFLLTVPPSYLRVTSLKLCNLLMTSNDLNLEVEVGKDERVGVKVEMEVAVGGSESGRGSGSGGEYDVYW